MMMIAKTTAPDRRRRCRMSAAWVFLGIAAGFFLTLLSLPITVDAQDSLRYSCSAQVYRAFERERLDQFTKESGISVELMVSPSVTTVLRLMNGDADVASSAQRIPVRHQEKGLVETPFAQDHLAVITHSKAGVSELAIAQVRQIFSGGVKNWKELGGADLTVLVVIPGKETAAFRNFDRLLMDREEISHDVMTYQSTTVLDIVANVPGAVSFISHGSVMGVSGLQEIRIDGKVPGVTGYPFYQTFSFVTNSSPNGQVKSFIDFALSDKGREIIEKKGMVPVSQ